MAAQDGDIKIIRGLSKTFIVDGFNYQLPTCMSYFLTHYHSDHTTGLYPSFSGPGVIYTSQVTADLLIHDKGVKPCWVVALPLNTTTMVEGVEVTLLDANHCPGAVMFHFHEQTTEAAAFCGGQSSSSVSVVAPNRAASLSLPPQPPFTPSSSPQQESTPLFSPTLTFHKTKSLDAVHGQATNKNARTTAATTVLHVGDFRAERCVCEDKHLLALLQRHGGIDTLYLDTTYCAPKHDFPAQAEVLASLESLVRFEIARHRLSSPSSPSLSSSSSSAASTFSPSVSAPSTSSIPPTTTESSSSSAPNSSSSSMEEQRQKQRPLFVCSAYSVGKEKALVAVARAAGGKVLVSERRANVLFHCGWWQLGALSSGGDRDCDVEVGKEGRQHEEVAQSGVKEGGGGGGQARSHATNKAALSDVGSSNSGSDSNSRSCRKSSGSAGGDNDDDDDDDDEEEGSNGGGGGGGGGEEDEKALREKKQRGPSVHFTTDPGDPQLVALVPQKEGGSGGGGGGVPSVNTPSGLRACLAALPGTHRFGCVVGLKMTGWTFRGGRKGDNSSSSSSGGGGGGCCGGGGGGGGGVDSQAAAITAASGGSLEAGAAISEAVAAYRPWVEAEADVGSAESECETRVYSLPYSEHSSYSELRSFVATVKPKALLPTVNATDPATRRALVDKHFVDLMDLSKDRGRIVSYFSSFSSSSAPFSSSAGAAAACRKRKPNPPAGAPSLFSKRTAAFVAGPAPTAAKSPPAGTHGSAGAGVFATHGKTAAPTAAAAAAAATTATVADKELVALLGVILFGSHPLRTGRDGGSGGDGGAWKHKGVEIITKSSSNHATTNGGSHQEEVDLTLEEDSDEEGGVQVITTTTTTTTAVVKRNVCGDGGRGAYDGGGDRLRTRESPLEESEEEERRQRRLGYLSRLLVDAEGSVENAVAIHFAANGGAMPSAQQQQRQPPQHIEMSRSSSSPFSPLSSSSLSPPPPPSSLVSTATTATAAAAVGLEFPPRASFVVFGSAEKANKVCFARFGHSKAKVEARLRALGAKVTSRRCIGTTHVLLGDGVRRSAVPHRLLSPRCGATATPTAFSSSSAPASSANNTADDAAALAVEQPCKQRRKRGKGTTRPAAVGEVVVVDESWLFRHVRAAQLR